MSRLGLAALAVVGAVACAGPHQHMPAPGTVDGPLATIRSGTVQYADVRLAYADGFRQTTGVLEGSAAHLMSQRHLDDGRFDPAHPEVLLYDGVGPDELVLVGVAFLLPLDGEPPTAFGPEAHWHEHDFHRSCLSVRVEGGPRTFRVPDDACRAAGDVVIPPRFRMLHVWLYSESPEGTFAELNSTIGR